MAVSLRPSDVSQGLIDDADVTIKAARYVRYDWPKKDGTRSNMTLALALTLVLDGQERTEYLSSGDLQYFVPTADGKGLDKVGTRDKMASTKASRFLESLCKAGFPENRLGDGNISVLDGLAVHVTRVPAKKATFKDGRTTKDDATELRVSKVLSNVGRAAGASDASGKAISTVQSIISANGGRFESAKLGTEVFKQLMADPQRNDVLKLVTPDFLAKNSGTAWLYDAQAGLLIAA